MIKKIIALLTLSLAASAVYAACVTNTIVGRDGRVTVCTTCCINGQSCTTTCM